MKEGQRKWNGHLFSESESEYFINLQGETCVMCKKKKEKKKWESKKREIIKKSYLVL